jgi:flagellar hook-basal body complex protein FliE
MPSPIDFDPSRGPIGPVAPAGPQGAAALRRSTSETGSAQQGTSFKDVLLDSLDQVNRLQQDASQSVEKLATGQTANVAEVFTAVRKADVAFSLLMEMRNKLMDAYQEIRQMQV